MEEGSRDFLASHVFHHPSLFNQYFIFNTVLGQIQTNVRKIMLVDIVSCGVGLK